MMCDTITCDTDKYSEKRWSQEERYPSCDEDVFHGQISYDQILEWDVPSTPTASKQEVVTIGAIPFLKTMWALFWTSFRYPFTNTVIDMTTGDIVRESSGKGS